MFKGATFTIKGLDNAKKTIKLSLIKNDLKLDKLASDTEAYMKELIYSRKRGGKRITSKLAESIKYERVMGGTTTIYGIGRVSSLPKYYKTANYGMVIPGKKFGYFEGYAGPNPSKAGTGVGDEVFTSERGGFFLNPKNPAQPLNYIEDTFKWAVTVFTGTI